MRVNKYILLLILLFFAFNGPVALSENSSLSNISQNYTSGPSGESLKTSSVDRSNFSNRDLDTETSDQAEVNRKKAAPSENKFKLFKNSPYNIFTLYPDELGLSQLLNQDSEPVGQKFDFDGWFGSPNSTTKVFFGTLPFVSVPVSNNNEGEEEPGFISKDSIFVFWYIKRSF